MPQHQPIIHEPEEGQLVKYADYAAAETAAGREPLPMPKWRAERMHAPKADAEAPAPDDAAPSEPTYDPATATLSNTHAPAVETLSEERDPLVPAVETPTMMPTPEAMPDQLIFSAENRNRVEVMQAGQKVLVNGTVIALPHRVIEFQEYHWTADMRNRDQREKAEWLMTESDAFRRGEILCVQQIVPRLGGVQVATGPRTSRMPRAETIPARPAGELSARIT